MGGLPVKLLHEVRVVGVSLRFTTGLVYFLDVVVDVDNVALYQIKTLLTKEHRVVLVDFLEHLCLYLYR